MPYQTNISPKKLTLSEMWELYHLLAQDSPTGDLMEDVHRILEHTPPVYIDTAMHLLYDDTVSISDGMTLLVYLMRGLRVNEYFKFYVLLNFLRQ